MMMFTEMEIALMEGGHSLYEDASTLNIGDPVIITGKGIEFEGTTGEIVDFGQDNRFVVVNLYNHGKHSFHSSDVSYNDYADSDEEEARMYDRGEFRDDVDEGWKEKAAAAALAGATAMGGASAQAQNIDMGQVMHGALGHIGRMSNNPNWNKSVAIGSAQKALQQGVQQHVQQERAADQELLRKITDPGDRQRFAVAARDKDHWRHAAITMRDGMDMGKAAASIAYYKEIKREMMSKYLGHAESVDNKVAGRYDSDEFDAMVARVGKLAKAGPLKTVWDPEKRVYKNVPVKQDKKEVDEASLATMRKYFAGDTDAQDPTKLAQMRDFFNKNRDQFSDKVVKKEFNSIRSYEQWLEKQGMKKVKEDEESGETQQNKNLIPFPAGTTKVDVGGDYDWYKLGMVISDLDDADPNAFGKGPASAMIAFGSEDEEHKYKDLLARLGMKIHDIDQPQEGVKIIPASKITEMFRQAMKSKKG